MNVAGVFQKALPAKEQPSDLWPIPDCRVGLEFELENPDRLNPAARDLRELATFNSVYEVHDDGSLRDRGFEFVLRAPLLGVDLVAAVDFARLMQPFTISYRTSVHVHIDVRDLELQELRTACVIYALTEWLFYNVAGPEREQSNYCVPWYFCDEFINHAAEALFAPQDVEGTIRAKVHRLPRYSGMNLQSISKYGSIEFRQLQTTFDIAKLKAWISLCMCIKKAAVSNPDPRHWQQLAENPGELYAAVFSSSPLAWELVREIPSRDEHATCVLTAAIFESYYAMQRLVVYDYSQHPDIVGNSQFYQQAFDRIKEAG